MGKKKQPKTVEAIAVRVHANVPGHQRRRAGHTFTANPLHFAKGDVPDEVLDDDYLVKKEVEVTEDQLVSAAAPSEEKEPAKEKEHAELTDEQKKAAHVLTGISGIGQSTAEKLVLAGVDVDKIVEFDAEDPSELWEVMELNAPQKTAIESFRAAAAEDPELVATLKAERIQES